MTGVAFEPKVGGGPVVTGGGEAPAPGPTDQPGFATMLAAMASPGSNAKEESAELNEALALLHSIAAQFGAVGNGQGESVEQGFLAGEGAALTGASDARGMAAIFNEFGLFGLPVSSRQPAIDEMAQRALTVDSDETSGHVPAETEPGAPARLKMADAAFWSGPEYQFVTWTAPKTGGANQAPAAVSAAPPPSVAPLPPPAAAASAAEVAAAEEISAVEESMRAARRPDQQSAAGSAPRILLSMSEQMASLVARLERLSREERIRLHQEAVRILATHGLVPSEIRINGSVDGRPST